MISNRRHFIRLGLASLGAVASATLWPLRALAAAVRPDAAFSIETMDAVMKQLGGTPAESTGIEFKAPEIAENGAVVPISVNSTIPNTEEITIIAELNPNPLTAIFVIPKGTKPSISTRIKLAKTQKVIVVVKADGKLFSTSKETKVTLGGCGG